MTKRAATTRLEPGQHSIDRVKAFSRPGRVGYTIKWHLRLPSGRLYKEEGTQTHARTIGQARAKARLIATGILSGAGNGRWKGTSSTLDYMEAVTLPAIRKPNLQASTIRRYELAYRLLRGECGDATCKHVHSLAVLTLYDAMRPRALTSCLEEIARLHGVINEKHAKTVAKKYLAAPLRIDEVIEYNPLADLDIDLSEAKRPAYSRGGRALSLAQYRAVIDYLLNADPEDVEKPKRGRWTREHRVIERATCIDIILAQATTGMRTSELCLRPVSDCRLDDDGTFIVTLPGPATKTKKDRVVPVLGPSVSVGIAHRLGAGSPWLFPSPTDPTKLWNPRNRDRKLAVMYQELSEKLDIEMFEHERGHSWRTTNNTLLYDLLPEATRIRLFGHGQAVNRQRYTAVTSTGAVVSAASPLFER